MYSLPLYADVYMVSDDFVCSTKLFRVKSRLSRYQRYTTSPTQIQIQSYKLTFAKAVTSFRNQNTKVQVPMIS